MRVMVYNASMKYEMRAKAELHSKHTIHTIHSAAQFIFEGVCGSNDDGRDSLHQYPQMDMTRIENHSHHSRRSARHQADLLRLHINASNDGNLRSPKAVTAIGR
jgi:hypothetical protein